MSKYVQLSERLEAQIRGGEWERGKVPTVRDLAVAHGVSALTASRALQVLQSKGLIQTVERSGIVVVPQTEPAERWGLVLRVTAGTWQPASVSVVQAGFDGLGGGEGVFESNGFDLREGTGPADYARQAGHAADSGMSGVFFLPARVSEAQADQDRAFLGACRAAGLPVVLLDRNLRGAADLGHDLVCSDHSDGGRRCTDHLLGLGRRRIACVIGSPTSSHIDREAGYLFALSAARRAGVAADPLVLPLTQDAPGRETFGGLAAGLLDAGADGVLCYQDYVAVGLILELLRRGVRVPGDIAVTGCDDLPIGNTFSVGVTTYAYPSLELARQAVRLMRDRLAAPGRPPVKVVVPGRLVVRDSSVGEGR
jgi:LacI family transcriptional regulator